MRLRTILLGGSREAHDDGFNVNLIDFAATLGGIFGRLNIYANMGHSSRITSHVQKGSHYWLDILKAEGFVPPPSVYEKFLYLLIVGRVMICYCTIWPARGVYFSTVFSNCISQLSFSTAFVSVFLNCTSKLVPTDSARDHELLLYHLAS